MLSDVEFDNLIDSLNRPTGQNPYTGSPIYNDYYQMLANVIQELREDVKLARKLCPEFDDVIKDKQEAHMRTHAYKDTSKFLKKTRKSSILDGPRPKAAKPIRIS